MAVKKWILREADKEKASVLSEKFNIDPFIAYLLVSRGIDTELAVSSFLSDSFEIVSPFHFADMEEAAFTIGDAVDAGEKICIYGDYDCDGITSTALLYSFLKEENADVFYYIPQRLTEGYGMNTEAIDAIKAQGAQLIITVDNGISSLEEAEYIYSLGMRLVVTDHHQLGDTLPRAEAVVNPYRAENELEFRDYCGVGVVFKLICAMYEGEVSDLVEQYIDLVAIGTIGDVVPLLAENRAFVKAGLQHMQRCPRKAIEAVKRAAGKSTFTAGEIAFLLCPRLNAMGRMGDAARAVEFLISEDEQDCTVKYEQLCIENTHRQETEREILDDVNEQIAENPKLVAGRVIVIAGERYHHGVTGIVASHVLEKYGKPTFIISIDEDGIARGSARSIEGFHIYDAINACSGDVIRFGGHPLAAGVTLKAESIDAFRQHINEYALSAYPNGVPMTLTIDCKISPNYLTLELADMLSLLEPYGAMNPQAVFGVYKMKLLSVTPLSEGRHVRLELEKKGRRIRAVKFGTRFEDFPYRAGDTVNLAVKIAKNFYNEKYYVSVQAVDVRLSDTDEERYFSEKTAYDNYRQTGRGTADLYPDRDTCAVIYKYLKAHGGYPYSTEDLYFRLQQQVTYGQLLFALKAFAQAGLITISDTIQLNPAVGKVKLEETKVLTTLRERLIIG